jgi:glucosamine-6-phosphate deaminase
MSKEFLAGIARVRVCPTPEDLGREAAGAAAEVINSAILRHGHARILAATGNSQLTTVEALARETVDWSRVTVFHLDEYLGLSATHPASFRLWIRTRIGDVLQPAHVHYIEGDTPDPAAEIARYSALLDAAPLDLAFVGFGENGHIAFNDPPVADFHDPATLKLAPLDEACRRQQVGEGHFPVLSTVPTQAFTVTCSALFRVAAWVCAVPDLRKATAVARALKGPVTPTCPASLVQLHPHARVFLDPFSSSSLNSL